MTPIQQLQLFAVETPDVEFKSLLGAEREALLAGLNHDLACEYQAMLMYTHYSAKLTDPIYSKVRELFILIIPENMRHARFLADKIVTLNGEPTTLPRLVPTALQPREMFNQALIVQRRAIGYYSNRAEQAMTVGDSDLKASLVSFIVDETRHKDELEHKINDLKFEHTIYQNDGDGDESIESYQLPIN